MEILRPLRRLHVHLHPPRLHPTPFSNPPLTHRQISKAPTEPLIQTRTHPAPHTGHIKILLLNRPEARNALSTSLLSTLHAELTTIASQPHTSTDPTRALILASTSPSAFCAGADLKERLGFTPSQTREFLTSLRSTFSLLSALNVPSISAISSLALGGGLELALATTMRVFGTGAVVGLPETRLGIIPGGGGTWRLEGLVGRQRARDLVLTGRRVGGVEAYWMGISDRLVDVSSDGGGGGDGDGKGDGDKVLDAALGLAREICEGGPVATREALTVYRDRDVRREEGEGRENKAYENVLGTEDRVEALRAFAEKRKPVFKGR